MRSSRRVLVVAPHPDDAELGCPALIEATQADILVLCGDNPARVEEAKNPQLDTHQDHRTTAIALRSAVRRNASTLLEYETPSTLPEWSPSAYLPVDPDRIARWTDAAREHVSQSGAAYFAGDYRVARARVHGYAIGHDSAEAYRVVPADARILLGITTGRSWSEIRHTDLLRPGR